MPHSKTCRCNTSIQNQIEHFTPIIRKIARTKDLKTKKALFKTAPKCITKFLSECSGALLRGDIELPQASYKRLKNHKKTLLYLANPKKSLIRKSKKLFNKKGGFLSLLPILGGILANTVIPLIIDKFRKK